MSVDLNTGNINLISDENEGGGMFPAGAGLQENLQIQKESILLNNNEQIEIRYNKADLQSAITKSRMADGDNVEKEEGNNIVKDCSNNVRDSPDNTLSKFKKMK